MHTFTYPRLLFQIISLSIIVVGVIGSDSHNGLHNPTTTTLDLYKCPDSELAFEINLTSYLFASEIKIKIKEKTGFPGCSSGMALEKANYTFINQNEIHDMNNLLWEEKTFLESSVSINPNGILAVNYHFYQPHEYCIDSYEENETGQQPTLVVKFCPVKCLNAGGNRLCIPKCCFTGKSYNTEEGCIPSGNEEWKAIPYDASNYESSSQIEPHYYKNVFNRNLSCPHGIESMPSTDSKIPPKILTNGKLAFITGERRWEEFDEMSFCADELLPHDSANQTFNKDFIVFLCVNSNGGGSQEMKEQSLVYLIFLFGTSAFLLLTAIIYLFLWDKQNTYGWIVFSICISQFFMRIFMGNAHLLGLQGNHELRGSNLCIVNGILAHFFMLSTFTWLFVINLNIFLAFRVLTPRSKSKNLSQFFYYSIVAWGIPLAIVITGVCLDHAYPDKESLVLVPEYGKEICFVSEWAQGPYVYYIIAVFLVIIICLSFMTFLKLYLFQRDTTSVRNSSNAKDRKLFYLYAKLSIVLGIGWIFEFISWAFSTSQKQHWVWTVLDIYNLLTAVFIFIIFVWKKSILQQLQEKYPIVKVISDKMRLSRFVKEDTSENSGATGVSVTSVQNGKKIELKTYSGTANKGFTGSKSSLSSDSIASYRSPVKP